MDIRKEIIEKLDKPFPLLGVSDYDRLKDCLNIKLEFAGSDHITTAYNIDKEYDTGLDKWFRGVIESLYYRPNKYVLVLEGKPGIGKDYFLDHLMFSDFLFCRASDSSCFDGLIYDFVVVNKGKFNKQDLSISGIDNFKVKESGCDKRLASYCTTTLKWQFPQRKNVIVLSLESINWELYNSINKELLWIEIFNKFKPNGK